MRCTREISNFNALDTILYFLLKKRKSNARFNIDSTAYIACDWCAATLEPQPTMGLFSKWRTWLGGCNCLCNVVHGADITASFPPDCFTTSIETRLEFFFKLNVL